MLVEKAAQILKREWGDICKLARAGKLKDWVDDTALNKAIHASVNSAIKTYRYVLPTQVVSKLASSDLDARCLQAARGGAGAFDARTIAHAVIVPFDQENENVLGGSPEPYVNNPLRVPEVSSKYRHAQRNATDWDHLSTVLSSVEKNNDEAFTLRVFRQVLSEIYNRLSTARVVYPAPKRVSLRTTISVIEKYLSESSGGDRLLAITSALFTVIGNRFGLFIKVRRGKITAADKPSGMLADLECVTKDGRIAFAVEVKDRKITISQVKTKLRNIREKRVSEIFFIATKGVVQAESSRLDSLIAHEFASGQNIYITDLFRLGRTVLALVGEEGRHDFLIETGNQLEEYGSDITHRKAWASILADL